MSATHRPLTRAETVDLAARIGELLSTIAAGDLDATAATTYRLEGALAVLDVVAGRPSSLLGDLLNRPAG